MADFVVDDPPAEEDTKGPAERNFEGMNYTRQGREPYTAIVDPSRAGIRATAFDPEEIQQFGGVRVSAEYDDQWLYSFAAQDPTFIRKIQYGLLGAGLIDDNDIFAPGVFDDVTSKGMSSVLGYANRAGITWEQALDELMQGGMERMAALNAAKKGPKGPVFTARLSNPDDLKKMFRQTAYNMLGGQFIAEDQQQAFVDAYHQIELGAQRAAFDAQVGGGGTVVDAPNPQTTAEQQVEQLDPDGVKAKRINDYASMFEKMIGGM